MEIGTVKERYETLEEIGTTITKLKTGVRKLQAEKEEYVREIKRLQKENEELQEEIIDRTHQGIKLLEELKHKVKVIKIIGDQR